MLFFCVCVWGGEWVRVWVMNYIRIKVVYDLIFDIEVEFLIE